MCGSAKADRTAGNVSFSGTQPIHISVPCVDFLLMKLSLLQTIFPGLTPYCIKINGFWVGQLFSVFHPRYKLCGFVGCRHAIMVTVVNRYDERTAFRLIGDIWHSRIRSSLVELMACHLFSTKLFHVNWILVNTAVNPGCFLG